MKQLEVVCNIGADGVLVRRQRGVLAGFVRMQYTDQLWRLLAANEAAENSLPSPIAVLGFFLHVW